jgi:hypothetical protein
MALLAWMIYTKRAWWECAVAFAISCPLVWKARGFWNLGCLAMKISEKEKQEEEQRLRTAKEQLLQAENDARLKNLLLPWRQILQASLLSIDGAWSCHPGMGVGAAIGAETCLEAWWRISLKEQIIQGASTGTYESTCDAVKKLGLYFDTVALNVPLGGLDYIRQGFNSVITALNEAHRKNASAPWSERKPL